MIGVGGSLDMMVGERRRAPEWVQRIGLEWVVRAAQEPKRLGVRYARDIQTMGPWLFRQWRASRARRSLPGLHIEHGSDAVAVGLGGTPQATLDDWTAAAARLAGGGTTLRIDPTAAIRLNDRAVAWVVGLVREARRADVPVVWAAAPDRLVPRSPSSASRRPRSPATRSGAPSTQNDVLARS